MRDSGRYILDANSNPVKVDSLDEWARWYEKNHNNRHVGLTKFDGDIRVSTVFLALDHNFDYGPPILYETMVFGGEYNGEQERYSTRAEALKGHMRWVQKVKDTGAKPDD